MEKRKRTSLGLGTVARTHRVTLVENEKSKPILNSLKLLLVLDSSDSVLTHRRRLRRFLQIFTFFGLQLLNNNYAVRPWNFLLLLGLVSNCLILVYLNSKVGLFAYSSKILVRGEEKRQEISK